MNSVFIQTAAIFHASISVVYAALIFRKRSTLPPAYIPIIICVPFFGFLSALTADLTNRFKGKLGDPGEIETVKLEKDIYWKTIRQQIQSENIVPLEEALIINDRQTRKKLVLEMLLDDPMKNIDILMLARENNDMDTAHYANTTIAKIQRDFQLHVEQLAAAHEADFQDMQVLDQYIQTLGSFIRSGLSEAYLLRRQRIIFASLLDEKIQAAGPLQEILQEKIDNALALKDINTAAEANAILRESHPTNEQTWLNELRLCIASHDAHRLKDTIKAIKCAEIDWSASGKELVSLWEGGRE